MADELSVESPAFLGGESIPKKYTADGEDVSPPLFWTKGPPGTVGYALIMDDPDAPNGTWVHWVAWNLPEPKLEERVPTQQRLLHGAVQGRNSWRRTGYGGPSPPSGVHRYYFRVYALDTRIDLVPEAGRLEVERSIRGHVLASGELMGRYGR
jgi:Raf kinase inhibitor-like YbhB/YbcL family protein